MRFINAILLLILVMLQYRFWFGHNGVQYYQNNRTEVGGLKENNAELQKRNELLAADVSDLKLGLEGIEERARNELGMIRTDETFFRLVENKKDQ